MGDYIALDAQTDPESIEADARDDMATAFPGWDASDASLESWLLKIVARLASITYELTGKVSDLWFQQFGDTIMGVAPIAAVAATGESTWTVLDIAGYTIEAGTEVTIARSGSEAHAFEVVTDVIIPAGSSVTAAGEVQLRARIPGTEANGLTADPLPSTALAFVSGIELTGATSGGVDAEDETDYRDRLSSTLQTLSECPVLPRDVEILALNVPGVSRALAIDGYNPADSTFNNERMVAVAGLDEAGGAISAPVKTDLDAALQSRREISFIFNVIDPAFTEVDIAAAITIVTGFDPATVRASVKSRLQDYLSPANWGHPPPGDTSHGGDWAYVTKVYLNELIALIDQVPGVDRVISVVQGGGVDKAFTVAASTDSLTSTAHGYSNGDAVLLTAKTNGAPLVLGTVYYVRDVTTNTFKLAATAGGAAIDITSDGSGEVQKVSTADITLTGAAPVPAPGDIYVTS